MEEILSCPLGERLCNLLERIAYNTYNGPLDFAEYRERILYAAGIGRAIPRENDRTRREDSACI